MSMFSNVFGRMTNNGVKTGGRSTPFSMRQLIYCQSIGKLNPLNLITFLNREYIRTI